MTIDASSDPNCVFCRIIERQSKANIRYENEHVLAFDDINPRHPIHVLVCPKVHYPTFSDTPPHVLGQLVTGVHETATALGLHDRGFRLVVNNRANWGQIVFHLHYHLYGRE